MQIWQYEDSEGNPCSTEEIKEKGCTLYESVMDICNKGIELFPGSKLTITQDEFFQVAGFITMHLGSSLVLQQVACGLISEIVGYSGQLPIGLAGDAGGIHVNQTDDDCFVNALAYS